MKKKYWLIHSTTRDGELEYNSVDTFIGEEKEIEDFIQRWRGFIDSYQEVKINEYIVIPKKDYLVLKKYHI